MNDFPMDLSTVFSIVPFSLDEFKPGLYPGRFKFEPCLDEKKPVRLLIKTSEHMMQVGGRKAPLRVTTPSFQIAKSIVDDFLDGQLFTDELSKPGICWVPGDVSVVEFTTTHAAKYAAIKITQKNWFVRLCRETDSLWAKYHHPRVVSDQARFAARFLGIATPEWMSTEVVAASFTRCPACSTMNDPQNAVCIQCSCVLDAAKFKTLVFASK